MKKIVMFGILSLLMLLPGLSLARTAITDADLDAVTAAAGVSIDFWGVTVSNATLTSASWGDPSGFVGYTGAGYFGLGNVTITGNLATLSGTMSIDVGTAGGETKVGIALPTLQLGDVTGVIQATLMAHTSSDFSSGTPQEGGILTLRGFSANITGSIGVYAHE